MTDIKCNCGRWLGRVEGKYELWCRNCKKYVAGSTTDVDDVAIVKVK